MSPLINFMLSSVIKWQSCDHTVSFSVLVVRITQNGVCCPHLILYSIQMSEIYLPLLLLEITSVLPYAQSWPYKVCLKQSITSKHLEIIKALIFK